MKLQTITTLELSNICNLSCSYCINRFLVKEPSREPGIMSDEVFEGSLKLIKKLIDRGTQGVINLNGNGESCLDSQLPERAAAVKSICNGNKVQMCTNGKNMTPELALQLAEAGVDQVDISLHSAEYTRRAFEYLSAVGILGVLSAGVIGAPHNWAGQLEQENCVKEVEPRECHALKHGWGYIQKEGWINVCCYDFKNLSTIGHVFDNDILEKELKPFSLCQTCHQNIK